MEEVLNKDVFIGVFIVLLIIAILINLALLLLLLLLPRSLCVSPHGVISPLNKLMTSCQARDFRSVGWCASPKRWLVAVCCVCHLGTACLHHALVVHLYTSRDGYLPPPVACSLLVLTEASAFLFPTLSRLLVGVLAVMEVLRMTSVRYLRVVTCVSVIVAGVYVSVVLLPVFFFLYLEAASEPCYPGKSILRYAASGDRGRVLPVVSYVLPVVLIIVAVVVMIFTYNFRKNYPAKIDSRSESLGSSRHFSSLGNGTSHLKNNNVGASPQRYSSDGPTSVRALSVDLQFQKNTKSRLSQSGCDSDEEGLVSFPWDTLVVCVLVVMLEFVFCVRQFAYWAQVDERIMSTSQWIQLWAADRTLSLLSLTLVPCCWLFDSYIRRVFHCQGKNQDYKQSEDIWEKEHTGSAPVYASRHPETGTARVDQNTLSSYESKTLEKGTLSFDGTQRESYRMALTTETDILGHSGSEESGIEFGEDALYEHRQTSHNSMIDRGMDHEATGNFQQDVNQRQQRSAHLEQWKNDDVDTIMMWRGFRQQNRPAAEQTPADTATSPKRMQPQSTKGHLDFSQHQGNSSGDYPSVLLSRDESNHTFLFKAPTAASPPTDPEEPENTSWGEKYHEQNSSYGQGKFRGTPSLPRNGVSTPNVLSGKTANHADVLKRNRSYPNMTNGRFMNHTANDDGVYQSENRETRSTNNPTSRTEWPNSALHLPQRQEAHTLTNNKHRTDDATFRRGDKKTWHNGQERRDDYRMQQHEDDFFPNNRREKQNHDYLNRQRLNVNESRDVDSSPPRQQNRSTYKLNMSGRGKQITYNTSYKPADETLHNQHYRRDQPYQERESSRNAARTTHDLPGQNIQRQVPPVHQQPRYTHNNFGRLDSGTLANQGMDLDLAKAYDLQREGVMLKNERHKLTRRVPNGWKRDQEQRMRNSQGMTEEGTLPYRQEAVYRQEHTGVADVPENDRQRKTRNNMDREVHRSRPDNTGVTGSQFTSTSTAHRRLPRQTAFIQGQGDWPSDESYPDQRQDRIHFHGSGTGETDGRLGYTTFVNDLNPEPSRNKSSSAGYSGQGHLGYRDVDEYLAHRGRQYAFQEQGQGHVQHRGQGQDEHVQVTQEGGRNGRLTFNSHEPRRDRGSYNPESLC